MMISVVSWQDVILDVEHNIFHRDESDSTFSYFVAPKVVQIVGRLASSK